ncbi:MAG: RTX toxin, partial [Polaromonas sp.]
MPTLTLHMAPIGTPLDGGGSSSVGHMWYTIDNGSGAPPLSYGFAPTKSGDPFGPGRTYTNDSSHYLNTNSNNPIETRTVEISQSEFNNLNNFGQNPGSYGFSTFYNGLANSCVDFAWKAMQVAGLNKGQIEGAILPQWNKKAVEYTWKELQRTKLPEWSADINVDSTGRVTVNPICQPGQYRFIDDKSNTNFTAARNWTAPRDPLILDLDGDGIEAIGINPVTPILFDMDGDGVKTATGWIKADDGIVVLDRNGNGLIDSGRELFGDSTVLTRGPRAGQTAANGYEALADLDINGDGAINSADAAYADLRVWQDANQDGISQANELRTLSDAGIASMNVAGQV